MATSIDALEARVVDVEKGVAVVKHDVASVRHDVQRLETLILAQLAELKVQIAKLLERQHEDEIETAKRKCPYEKTCMTVDGRLDALAGRVETAEKQVDYLRLWQARAIAIAAALFAVWPIVRDVFLK